ncbi:MAG: 1-acyl-sn-glycerol-3-phosphate acyltransferase [Actinobacteria bacterium]|nr:MAG: 1-acyl-sn-glycerol-3-phosphate acyltransferase [Actinomycetota bacterium]
MARGRLGFWQWVAVVTVKPTMTLWTRRDWSGMANIPAEGGVILAANHLSEVDPLVVAHFVYDAGRWPQFLAKSSLFNNKIIGSALRSARQIPVFRGTADAVKSLEAATAAVRAGDAVLIYPEGTTPKAGDLWPQRGKTGVARLFLETGAPVVPIVTWGPQRMFDPRREGNRPGRRLNLNLYAITDEVMTALRDLLAGVRGEPAPEQPSAARNGGAG